MDDLSRYAQRPFGFYLRYVRLRLFLRGGILLAGFAAAVCSVGTQYGLKFPVDALSGNASHRGEAWFAFGLLISLLAADHLLSRLGGVIASVTFPRVAADLRSDIFRHVMGHSPSYFADRLPGTLTSRITATSNAVIALENMFAWNVLPPIVGNIGAIAILAAVTPTVTAGLGLVVVGMILVIFRLAAAAKPLHRVFATKAATVDGEIVDVIGNMPIVRAFGGIRRESARIREPLAGRRGSIVFDNVGFGYPGGTRVFDGFNLHIEAGQRVGLVGESGGGKSTVFALLQRFYDVDAGRILIDGQDIGHVSQESLREVIGTVPQDTSLFHRSIMDNIRYGRPEAGDEEVLAAARAAHCLGFILAMPEGFATLVGERGVKLSGGQRQRIAIARAFLKNAPILLLDEATSALDIESEEAIREALDRLIRGRTVIAIAHLLSTLRGFDRILVLH